MTDERATRLHLVVFGGSGPTGLRVVRRALGAGHRVTAVTRRPDDFPLTAEGLRTAKADVADADAVRVAVSGADAVVSTYGVPYTRRPVTVYSTGVAHILRAMTLEGVSRLVCVSSTTVADGSAPGESLAWRRVVEPLLLRRVLGRTVYDDMERMEALLRESDLDWTIVRPAGLYNADEPGPHDVGPPRLPGRFTSRADLADVLVREATDARHSRTTVDVVSRGERPSPLTFLREVTKIGT
ncbi:NAD(P)-dependent oxidoreductase [Phycicoccus flavus]|uniref:NAD(P)-dependent oxidoreductase n=1 Tax=Phycicoccus flavus TaxID=2502783 RepID=UPI000FEBC9F5|nr:NAD(P)H-binding protein [Phycicoccus flavus]NHA70153.1 NAD(P)H-binding protein [Phycicoccus flavus]